MSPGIPNSGSIFKTGSHKRLVCSSFHLLGGDSEVSLEEVERSISLGLGLLDMSVPAGIRREVYTEIFHRGDCLHGDSVDGIDMLHDETPSAIPSPTVRACLDLLGGRSDQQQI